MSSDFEKFLMEKINLIFKVAKWLFIFWIVGAFLLGFISGFLR